MKKYFALFVSIVLLCTCVPCFAETTEPRVVSTQRYQQILQEDVLLARAHQGIDERSAEVRQDLTITAEANVQSSAYCKKVLSIAEPEVEYTTQLLSKTVYSDGSSIEEYATTAIAKATTYSGSSSDSSNSGSTYVYVTVKYSYKVEELSVSFTQTGSTHKVTYSSNGPTAQVLEIVGILRDAVSVRGEVRSSKNSPTSGTTYSLGAPKSGLYLPKAACTMSGKTCAYMSNGTSVDVELYLDANSL